MNLTDRHDHHPPNDSPSQSHLSSAMSLSHLFPPSPWSRVFVCIVGVGRIPHRRIRLSLDRTVLSLPLCCLMLPSARRAPFHCIMLARTPRFAPLPPLYMPFPPSSSPLLPSCYFIVLARPVTAVDTRVRPAVCLVRASRCCTSIYPSPRVWSCGGDVCVCLFVVVPPRALVRSFGPLRFYKSHAPSS
ncbi:hypothetical protein BC628DRAFT_902915 [Trametes gibbosa]|nr:hypothetical protein BC628DRAFT_902915 [Trametes gibbosa]